ncbi:MAG: stage III sporulation protein AE, partial [Lachnospira sp.]|nr:stage III sporulation protein AE [Lachnospira sp.]
SSFLPDLNKGQVFQYAHMVIEIILITILAASFFSACNECIKVISVCVDIYRAIIPVFFSAVLVTTGNATVAAYYEVVLMMITVVNTFYKNVFVGIVKMYFLLIICDMVTGKEQFSKMCELFQSFVKLGCKTTIAIFAGIGGLKGMINPMSDSLKKNVVIKGLKLVPVIGSTVDSVSGTLVGAGAIIKNGIGLAGIIVLVTVCMIPVLKLVVISLLYKITAAVIEPIAGKKLVKVVNSTGVAIGMLCLIDIVVLTLFVLMLAIICIATNIGG